MRLGLIMLCAALCLAAKPPPELDAARVYDPMSTADQEAMAKRLLLHVPLLEITIDEAQDTVFGENPRTGYAVVLSDRRVACLSHLLQGALSVTLVGPKGRLPARVLLVDHERRVGILEPQGDLHKIGLYPITGVVPKKQREVDMTLFALVSTLELAGVSQGVLTHQGTLIEYQGFPRVDLKLDRGMPVFDRRARLVGYSRVVAWDVDRFMIIPPEMIQAARTSSAARARPAPPKKASRPWWAK